MSSGEFNSEYSISLLPSSWYSMEPSMDPPNNTAPTTLTPTFFFYLKLLVWYPYFPHQDLILYHHLFLTIPPVDTLCYQPSIQIHILQLLNLTLTRSQLCYKHIHVPYIMYPKYEPNRGSHSSTKQSNSYQSHKCFTISVSFSDKLSTTTCSNLRALDPPIPTTPTPPTPIKVTPPHSSGSSTLQKNTLTALDVLTKHIHPNVIFI